MTEDEFVFPEMTPTLEEYLTLSGQHPGYKYPQTEDGRMASSKPTPESEAAVNAWREKLKALKDTLAEGLLGRYWMTRKEWLCRDGSQQGESMEHLSPSGRYRLVVTTHGTTPGCWSYSKGRVYSGDQLVTTVCRNYGAFPFLFVEDHPNGHSYLLCGEDYQGQTVIELDTGRRNDILPKSAEDGFGFCWAAYTASPSKRTLAVDGCFWACPYEVWLIDFTDPMAVPLPILHRESEADQFFAWTGSDTCQIGRSFEVYVPLNKRVYDLTNEEDDEASRRSDAGEKDLFREDREVMTWERPSDADSARAYVQSLLRGWRGLPIPRDFVEMGTLLLERLPDQEEKARLLAELTRKETVA